MTVLTQDVRLSEKAKMVSGASKREEALSKLLNFKLLFRPSATDMKHCEFLLTKGLSLTFEYSQSCRKMMTTLKKISQDGFRSNGIS